MRELVSINVLKVSNTLAFELNTRARSSDQLVDCLYNVEILFKKFKEAHVVTVGHDQCLLVKYINDNLSLSIDWSLIKSFGLREINE